MESRLKIWLMNRGVYQVNLVDMNDKELSEWNHFIKFMSNGEPQ